MNRRMGYLTAACCAAIYVSGCYIEGTKAPTAEQIDEARQQFLAATANPRARRQAELHPERTARDEAADALARIGRPAVPSLVQSLHDPDPAVRIRGARVLARIGPEAEEAVAPLTAALNDSDAEVRQAAAHALGQIGESAEPAVPRLIEMLHEPDPSPTAPAVEDGSGTP